MESTRRDSWMSSRVYLTWGGLNRDLREPKHSRRTWEAPTSSLPKRKQRPHSAEYWADLGLRKMSMMPGDWVILPSKFKPRFTSAKSLADYTYEPDATDPFYHHRTVNWLETDIPRSNL